MFCFCLVAQINREHVAWIASIGILHYLHTYIAIPPPLPPILDLYHLSA